jgi:aryl carrier-like protein
MLPGAVVPLGALPLTPNGKLDRRALVARKPAAATPVRPAAVPRTARERQVAGVWQEILEVETVGLHDSFLDLGGNSLRLAVLRGRLEAVLGRQLDIVDLFRHPTIAAFLDFLDAPADRPNRRSPDPGARSRGRARLAHQARSRAAAAAGADRTRR